MAQLKKLLVVFAVLTIGILTAPVSYANITWSFGSSSCTTDCSNINSETYGNSQEFKPLAPDSGPNVTVTAWSSTWDDDGNPNEDSIQSAHLTMWSGGLGVRSREDGSGSPQHAMDNNGNSNEPDYGDVDSVMLTYTQPIEMDGVMIGWPNNGSYDSDITVSAYKGSGVPNIGGKTYSSLVSEGWKLVGHYTNLQDHVWKPINSSNTASSYWLISAYNKLLGGNQYISMGNDYVKLWDVRGDPSDPVPPQSVPSPHALALLVMGLAGFRLSRQKRSFCELIRFTPFSSKAAV